MMRWIPLLLMVSSFALSGAACATQGAVPGIEARQDSTKFAIMVNNERHFRGAVKTAQAMGITEKDHAYQIVAVGPLVQSLVRGGALEDVLDHAESLGLRIVACEMALAHFEISKEALDPRVQTAANAWIYMWDLGGQGYLLLTP